MEVGVREHTPTVYFLLLTPYLHDFTFFINALTRSKSTP